MPTTIDLATINAAQVVIVAALRNQCCQWEQDSSDAAIDGHLSTALMLENWAFAADLLAGIVTTDLPGFFGEVLNAHLASAPTTPLRILCWALLPWKRHPLRRK